MEQAFITTLTDTIPRAPGTASFRFVRPADYQYTAGQWFILTIPGPNGPLTKHFTHSSAPTEPYLEFTTRLTGSKYKTALEQLPLGSEVEIEGPFGSFTLRPGLQRVAFLTGGIGVTPVRSILRHQADHAASGIAPPDVDIVVVYGNEALGTITFRDELSELAEALPRLEVVHVLSDAGDDWKGWRGHVRGEILDAELAEPDRWTYYVSGPPGMVQAMREMLRARGIPRAQMVLENFEGYE